MIPLNLEMSQKLEALLNEAEDFRHALGKFSDQGGVHFLFLGCVQGFDPVNNQNETEVSAEMIAREDVLAGMLGEFLLNYPMLRKSFEVALNVTR